MDPFRHLSVERKAQLQACANWTELSPPLVVPSMRTVSAAHQSPPALQMKILAWQKILNSTVVRAEIWALDPNSLVLPSRSRLTAQSSLADVLGSLSVRYVPVNTKNGSLECSSAVATADLLMAPPPLDAMSANEDCLLNFFTEPMQSYYQEYDNKMEELLDVVEEAQVDKKI